MRRARLGTSDLTTVEGGKNAEWIIVDFVDVVPFTSFHRDKREFYALEELWSDAVLTQHK
jgi:ribosome-associated protein